MPRWRQISCARFSSPISFNTNAIAGIHSSRWVCAAIFGQIVQGRIPIRLVRDGCVAFASWNPAPGGMR